MCWDRTGFVAAGPPSAGRPTIVAPARIIDWIEAVVGREGIDYAPIRETYAGAVEDISRLGLAGLFYWEVGTDALNYALAFHRFAPRQCTALGVGTRGCPEIDAYLSSRRVEPENAAEHYSERLILGESLLACHDRYPLPQPLQTRDDFGFPPGVKLYLVAQRALKHHPDHDA